YDIENKPLEHIEPRGLSGCGIWYITIDKNSKNEVYSLLGIQSSYIRQSQVLVGIQIEPLINEICSRYGFVIN
ncbi:MAG: hypothetical protein KAQ90_05320, partial [Melioribacteraceae bacterium]|nr:hypothetical protein [Melioribacteraceae bacterium]